MIENRGSFYPLIILFELRRCLSTILAENLICKDCRKRCRHFLTRYPLSARVSCLSQHNLWNFTVSELLENLVGNEYKVDDKVSSLRSIGRVGCRLLKNILVALQLIIFDRCLLLVSKNRGGKNRSTSCNVLFQYRILDIPRTLLHINYSELFQRSILRGN